MKTSRHEGVLVVGGGYAGIHAARQLMRRRVPVTVIDPVGVHGFVTRLSGVAGGEAHRGDAFAPLSALVPDVRLGRVVALDDGVVELDDGSRLEADAVVVTAGSVPIRPDIDGLHRAATLRTPSQALTLRDQIAASASLVVVGGGATGVQLAGAAAEAHPDLEVHLVDREPQLLSGMDEALADHAATVLGRRGVTSHLDTEVEAITTDGVRLDGGATVDGTVVWAAGFQAAVDDLAADLPLDEGRIRTDRELRIDGWVRTFVAGDVALHRDPDGEPLPMSAQIAVQAGDRAGANAARLVQDRTPRPADLRHRGWVLDLGGRQAVARLGPLVLAAPGIDRLAPLLHWAIDIKHLLEIAGPAGLAFAPGLHRPSGAVLDRVAAAEPAALAPT